MTFEEFDKMMTEKYHVDFARDYMNESELIIWLYLCSMDYIESGKKRETIYSTADIHDGKSFEIIRPAFAEDGFDLEALPFFLVNVNNGEDECFYYPNELFADA